MKPTILIASSARGTSFEVLGRQIQSHMPEWRIFSCPSDRVPQDAVCDVLVCLWWRDMVSPMPSRIRVTKSKVVAVYDHHSWTHSPACARSMTAALAESDYLVAGNLAILDQLRGRYDLPPAFVCETGADTDKFPLAPLPKNFTAMWAGNSQAGENDLKGFELAKEAARLAYVPFRVADSSGVHGDVVPHERMAEWYAGGSALIVASKSEGAPRTALEALSCGRPVVATRVGLVPHLVAHGISGAIVERDARSISQGLSYVQIAMRDRASDVQLACRRAAEANGTGPMIAKWLRVLQTAIGDPWHRRVVAVPPQGRPDPAPEPEAESPATLTGGARDVAKIETDEILGRVLPAADLQSLVAAGEPHSPSPHRMRVLCCSAHRFASRTLKLIRPMQDRVSVRMDTGELAQDVDVVWALYPFSDGMRAVEIKELTGAPLVMALRGSLSTMRNRSLELALHCYRRADAIVCLSGSLADELRHLDADVSGRICVIPNGGLVVDDPPAQFPWPGPTIGMLTNLRFEGKRRALDDLVAEFGRRTFDGCVAVAGHEGKFSPPRGKIGRQVRYLGFVAQRLSLLRACDAFIYSSHIDGQPTALIEAMGAGLACVVVRHGGSGAHEFVEHGKTGLVFDSPSEAADAAIRLANETGGERERLGAAARRHIETALTWESSADRHVALFRSLVRR